MFLEKKLFVQAIGMKHAREENCAIGSSSSLKCYCCNEFFRPRSENYHEKIIDYFEAPSSLLSNASRIMNFGDRCEELW